jgi:hypothetical protein
MKTSRNFKVSLIVTMLVASSLIAVMVVAGLPRRTLATTGMPRAIETVSTQQITNGIFIDYRHVNAATIPQTWLDQARSLDTFFAHMSVGDNILDGMADLQAQNPTRYTIAVYSGGADWFVSNSGILHRPLGSNYQPLTKIGTFDNYIRNGGYHIANVAMMKFCPGDLRPDYVTITGQEIWDAYRPMMAALEQDYPNVTFVWWTFPLSSVTAGGGLGNDERAVFNAAVRGYCAANGCVLFDIADIQSHDPSGNPVVDSNGYEAMWDGYTSDGGHLNETGRQRVANAMWHLLARIAGWVPDYPLKNYLPIILK